MTKNKIDRSNKTMQTFEISLLLKERLQQQAHKKNVTLSYLIREILEKYLEERN